MQILEQHYVGRADRIMVINAPNFRNIAYLVYPLVPKEVKAKIEICGRRYHERLRELLVPVIGPPFLHLFLYCFLSLHFFLWLSSICAHLLTMSLCCPTGGDSSRVWRRFWSAGWRVDTGEAHQLHVQWPREKLPSPCAHDWRNYRIIVRLGVWKLTIHPYMRDRFSQIVSCPYEKHISPVLIECPQSAWFASFCLHLDTTSELKICCKQQMELQDY